MAGSRDIHDAAVLQSDPSLHDRSHFMDLALREAKKALATGEVPIGALLVSAKGEVIASDHNRPISSCDPSAHAEILVIREAARLLSNYRLPNTTLYVTVEPCVMCMGAVIHARIETVVFGASEPRWGAAGSLYDFTANTGLNHRPAVISGVREDACKTLLQSFFKEKRRRDIL